MNRIACGCGWSYETSDRSFGSLYCTRQYREHLKACPLGAAAVLVGKEKQR